MGARGAGVSRRTDAQTTEKETAATDCSHPFRVGREDHGDPSESASGAPSSRGSGSSMWAVSAKNRIGSPVQFPPASQISAGESS
jgi:hypothetical protein